jgi:hypothetical protein
MIAPCAKPSPASGFGRLPRCAKERETLYDLWSTSAKADEELNPKASVIVPTRVGCVADWHLEFKALFGRPENEIEVTKWIKIAEIEAVLCDPLIVALPQDFGTTKKPAKKTFKTYRSASSTSTLKVAFARLLAKANTVTAVAFLDELIEAIPYKINIVLTDNGIQFADLPKNRSGPTATWRRHPFDRACQRHGIEHSLTKPNHPWTNGQVERMNRTLKEATVQRYYYDSHEQLSAHLAAFLAAYNFAKRLKTLRGLTPHEYVCKIWTEGPSRFRLDPIHHTTELYT